MKFESINGVPITGKQCLVLLSSAPHTSVDRDFSAYVPATSTEFVYTNGLINVDNVEVVKTYPQIVIVWFRYMLIY